MADPAWQSGPPDLPMELEFALAASHLEISQASAEDLRSALHVLVERMVRMDLALRRAAMDNQALTAELERSSGVGDGASDRHLLMAQELLQELLGSSEQSEFEMECDRAFNAEWEV